MKKFFKRFLSLVKKDEFKVFLLGVLINAFIFRKGLIDYPEILKGNKVLVTEELVPFFNWKTQFFDQIFNPTSELTGKFEFRIRYSFLTTWVRYYLFLPFALVFVNAASLTLIFYSIKVVLKKFFEKGEGKKEDSLIFFSALSPALLSYLILLYSKITHFYSLIFGFGLFSIVCSKIILLSIFFEEKGKKEILKEFFLILLLTNFNPAVHYVVITGMLTGIILIFFFIKFLARVLYEKLTLLFERLKRLGKKKEEISRFSSPPQANSKQSLISRFFKTPVPFLSFLLVSIPALYMFYYTAFITGFSPVDTSSVTITRSTILQSSMSLKQILSIQNSSPNDFFQFSLYFLEDPTRKRNMVYSFASLFFLVATFIQELFRKKRRRKIATFFALLIFIIATSVFFSIGFRYKFSAHTLFGKFVRLYETGNWNIMQELIIAIFANFFYILRFPHRFMFIYQVFIFFGFGFFIFYILSRLSLSFGWIRKSIGRIYLSLLTALMLLPFLSGVKVFSTFISGNYLGFVNTYSIPDDLKEIKSYLDKENKDKKKVFILPTAFTPFRVTEDLNKEYFKLIDKFLIYYLNQPSVDYGSQAHPETMNHYFFTYFLMSKGYDWFGFIKNSDFRYILYNKKQIPKIGSTYMTGLESFIMDGISGMESKGYFAKVYHGEYYELFEIREEYIEKGTPYFLNKDLETVLGIFDITRFDKEKFTFMDIGSQICKMDSFMIFGSDKKNKLDLLSLCNKRSISYNAKIYPFLERLESVSNFSQLIFPLFTLGNSPQKSEYNTMEAIIPGGTYNSLDKNFISLKKDTEITYRFKPEKDGEYFIELRGKSFNSQSLIVLKDKKGREIARKTVEMKDEKNFIDENGDHVLQNFTYFPIFEKLHLKRNERYSITIKNISESPLIIDNLIFYQERDFEKIEEEYKIEKISEDEDLFHFKKK